MMAKHKPAFALLLAATATAAAAQPSAPPAPAAVDADARCMMMVRSAAIGSRRAHPNPSPAQQESMGSTERAMAYFAGRLRARHGAGEITPLVAAAIRSDPAGSAYELAALTCIAIGMSGAEGEPADRGPAPSAEPPGAPAPDPDALCVLLMRAGAATLRQGAPSPDAVQRARLRGLGIATALYSGLVSGRYGAAAFQARLDAASRAAPPFAEVEALATTCFQSGADKIRAINLEIDAALARRAS